MMLFFFRKFLCNAYGPRVPPRWVGVALEGLSVATGHGQLSMCQLRNLRFEERIDLMVGLLCAETNKSWVERGFGDFRCQIFRHKDIINTQKNLFKKQETDLRLEGKKNYDYEFESSNYICF